MQNHIRINKISINVRTNKIAVIAIMSERVPFSKESAEKEKKIEKTCGSELK